MMEMNNLAAFKYIELIFIGLAMVSVSDSKYD
jgi:hypothetical protein